MKQPLFSNPLTLMLLLLAASPAAASGIYQVTDEHGNTTFTNVAPAKELGEAKPMDVRPPNITEEAQYLPGNNETFFDQLDSEQRQQDEQRQQQRQHQQAAEQAVRQAEQALEQAREVKAGDYYKNVNGGLRYKPEYLQRVKQAEQQLEQAREAASQPR